MTTCLCFDSILVRLKVRSRSVSAVIVVFRFHTGSIKRLSAVEFEVSDRSFDSILVRLKVQDKLLRSLCLLVFRFHTGSIKRFASAEVGRELKTFRFHTGSIKSKPDLTDCERRRSFDSILVRLKAMKNVEAAIPF